MNAARRANLTMLTSCPPDCRAFLSKSRGSVLKITLSISTAFDLMPGPADAAAPEH